MKTRDPVLSRAVDAIVRIADPEKIILFGSRATGVHGATSDYDILVLKKGATAPRRIAQDIYMGLTGLKAPVDVVVEEAETYERLKNDPYLLYHEASTRGKVLYEKR
ncbi:MAG TPA: nucleotidyltransferase domain-containing protein [Spirochaetia bacterium]